MRHAYTEGGFYARGGCGSSLSSLCLSIAISFCSRIRRMCFGCCLRRCFSCARLAVRACGCLMDRLWTAGCFCPSIFRLVIRFSASRSLLSAIRAWASWGSCGKVCGGGGGPSPANGSPGDVALSSSVLPARSRLRLRQGRRQAPPRKWKGRAIARRPKRKVRRRSGIGHLHFLF